MKKILFVLHYPPPVHGAAMVGEFIKNSKTINDEFNCKYINLGTSKSIAEIGNKGLIKFIRYFSILWKVIVQIIIFKPHILYLTLNAHGIGFYKDLPMALLAKVFRIKLIIHFHNRGVSERQEHYLDNILYRLLFKNVDVILLSKYLYPDIRKYIPENRVYYCPNGIPHQQTKKINSKGPDDRVDILFLSNLIESKGVFVLLNACQILQNRNLNFYCTFVGGVGDINESIFNSKVQELNLTKTVKYLGKRYGIQKEQQFANADIFAFPSYYETFGLVNLEAMQYNLPIVSTYEGGIPDIVENGSTGFLVQQKDPFDLANKLEILIKDPQLRIQMGKAGRAKYEREFTIQIFENNLKNILNKIIIENN